MKLGIDLGGTQIKAGLLDDQNQIISQETLATGARDLSSVVDKLSFVARDMRQKAGGNLVGIGIGVPGGVLADRATIHVAPNFPDWRDINLKGLLAEKGWPGVIVENDANCAALAEHRLGAGKGFRDSILFTLGTGVGGGVILNHAIHRGEWGMAGELGHLTVEPDGTVCGCGNRGCLEQYASGTAMLRFVQNEWQSSELQPRTPLEIYQKAKEGNKTCLLAFKVAGRALGLAVSSLIHIFNCPVFTIGGGVGESFDLLEPIIFEEIKKRTFPLAASEVKVQKARLGNAAGMIGAAMLV